jgi:hypothetical protein
VPGYFAADGNAGESSAESGTKWRAHLAPDKAGKWTYAVSFTRGKHAALDGGGVAMADEEDQPSRDDSVVAPVDSRGARPLGHL